MLSTGNIDGLSTRAIAEKSGVPVPTIYRYFADRDAIITALVERDLVTVDEKVVNAVLKLERVSLRGLIEAVSTTHFDHFQDNPRAKAFWFAARHSVVVLDRVKLRYSALSEWLYKSADKAGFLKPDTPEYGPALILWVFDRVYEYIYVFDPQSREKQEEILGEATEMVANHIAKYLTPAGIDGVPLGDFLTAVGDTRDFPFGAP